MDRKWCKFIYIVHMTRAYNMVLVCWYISLWPSREAKLWLVAFYV